MDSLPNQEYPSYINQAKEEALGLGFDADVVNQILELAYKFYQKQEVTEHLVMNKDALLALNTIYKYRSTEGKHDWDILEKTEIFFSNPRLFNDPFDSNILFRFDLLSDEELRTRYNAVLRAKYPDAGWFMRKPLIENYIDSVRIAEKHDSAAKAQLNRIIDKVGMLCLCPEKDNLLLWAHYANSHKGFAIGFDTDKLYEFYVDNHIFLMGYIAYRDEYPVLLPPSDDDNLSKADAIVSIMNIKSSIWAYEKEIRMTKYEAPYTIPFNPKLIKEVIMGHNMLPEHKIRLRKLIDTKFPHAILYQANLSRASYGLDFVKN